jgi:predicted PurR-regulated permease PerM
MFLPIYKVESAHCTRDPMRDRRELLININLLLIAVIAGAVVCVIAWRILEATFSVLVLLLAAMLLAFLLSPLVARMEATGFPRVAAVLTVYLMVLGIIFGLGGLLVVPLAEQIAALIKNLPKNSHELDQFVKNVDTVLAKRGIHVNVKPLVQQGIPYAQRVGAELLGNTLLIVQTVSTVVIDILAVIVISLYLLIDGPRIRHNILRIIPDSQRNRALFFDAALRTVIGGYVRGQLLMALTIGLMAAGGTAMLGVQYPLVIGLAAGFFELVPMLGPILGALPAIGIAATQSWQLAVATIVLFIVIQQLEAHLIAPRIMGHAVGVHPIVAILAVLLGAQLDGVLGALVAVPVAGIVYVMAQAMYAYATDQHQVVTVIRRRPFYVRVFRHLRGDSTATVAEETLRVTVEAPSDQLAGIVHERDVLAEQYELTERLSREAEQDSHPTQEDGPTAPVGATVPERTGRPSSNR